MKFKSKILEITYACSDTKHLKISTPDGFNFSPGQFISINLNNDGREIRRPYSIASKPYPNSLELCIKILPKGLGTPIIDKFKVGDEIDVLGPMGGFTISDKSLSKNIILISTGTGITPFRSMIHHLLENDFKNKLTLITGYRYEGDVLYEGELKALEDEHDNFSYHRILSREGEEKGYVQNLIEKNFDGDADYYICGLKEMIYSVKDFLGEKGISEDNVYFEKYD